MPASASLPFYLLGGFITERVGTVVVHSFLAFMALRGLLLGWPRFLLSAASAMLAHALIDATPMLFQMKLVTADLAVSDLLAGSSRVLYVNHRRATSAKPGSASQNK